jgi:flavin-dependent dehydrogenase
LIYRQPQPVRGHVILIGDAAAFIDPFAGDGISIALRSGQAAGRCVGQFLAGETTLTESVAAYGREYARQFAPLLSAASWVRSLLSLPAFELLRFPGVMPFVIRKTRRAG